MVFLYFEYAPLLFVRDLCDFSLFSEGLVGEAGVQAVDLLLLLLDLYGVIVQFLAVLQMHVMQLAFVQLLQLDAVLLVLGRFLQCLLL